MTQPTLALRDVSKSFGMTAALDDMSLDLFPGEVHAIVGENGAGKSTMIKIMTGVYQPDAGEIEIDGAAGGAARRPRRRDLPASPRSIRNRWCFPISTWPRTSSFPAPGGTSSTRRARRRQARALIARLGMQLDRRPAPPRA